MEKFLIVFEGNTSEQFELFAFIHNIFRKGNDKQINIISSNFHDDLFKALPFNGVNSIQLNYEKMGILELHKYAVNCHDIFNIDYFLSFTDSFKANFLGKVFNAKERFGLESGPIKSFFLKNKFKKASFKKLGELYFNSIYGKNEFDHNILKWEKTPENIVQLSSGLNILAENGVGILLRQVWDERIIDQVRELSELLSEDIKLINYENKSDFVQNIAKLSHHKLIITDDELTSRIVNYLGPDVILLCRENVNTSLEQEFAGSLATISIEDNKFKTYSARIEKIDIKMMDDLSEIILSYFKG